MALIFESSHQLVPAWSLRRSPLSRYPDIEQCVRDGQTRDSPATPVALEECVALGRDGVRGLVAARKASGQRTRGLCREQRVGLLTLVPRPGAVRQEVATWGQQQGALPLWLAKPGRTRQEPPRRWPCTS